MRVDQTRRMVVVTVPLRCREIDAEHFVRKHLEWARERLARAPSIVDFVPGATVPLRGVGHTIVHSGDRSRGRVVEPAMENGATLLRINGRAEYVPRRVKDWLVGEACSDLDRAVQRYCATLGLRARALTIRDQGSRWGSCSSNKTLSFSWRLIMAPPRVLDYVAAHEVAHLAEMNHGPRFWALIKRAMPEMEEARGWLRQNGAELHRYAPRN